MYLKAEFARAARKTLLLVVGGTLLARGMPAQEIPRSMLVETEPGVKLEVLDWGGSGPALVLLAGLGATARDFENSFVASLAQTFHVYGITRRGYGGSSAPIPNETNYTADRLGDDVLAVLDHLQIRKPILVGHSFAGEELSSVGSRRPDHVAGLVYLDAGYRYALSGPGLNDLQIDTLSMRRYLAHALDDANPADAKKAADAFLQELPEFQKELQAYSNALAQAQPMSASDIAKEEADRQSAERRVERAMLDGEQRYTSLRCPLLVVFAYPHELPEGITGQRRVEQEKADTDFVDQRLKLFKAQPNVTVLLLPHATHGVQDSKRAEVVQAIRDFAASLPR